MITRDSPIGSDSQHRLSDLVSANTFDAMCRLRDGQPLEQNLIELGIDFGRSPNEARESAREAMSGDACDLHKALD